MANAWSSADFEAYYGEGGVLVTLPGQSSGFTFTVTENIDEETDVFGTTFVDRSAVEIDGSWDVAGIYRNATTYQIEQATAQTAAPYMFARHTLTGYGNCSRVVSDGLATGGAYNENLTFDKTLPFADTPYEFENSQKVTVPAASTSQVNLTSQANVSVLIVVVTVTTAGAMLNIGDGTLTRAVPATQGVYLYTFPTARTIDRLTPSAQLGAATDVIVAYGTEIAP